MYQNGFIKIKQIKLNYFFILNQNMEKKIKKEPEEPEAKLNNCLYPELMTLDDINDFLYDEEKDITKFLEKKRTKKNDDDSGRKDIKKEPKVKKKKMGKSKPKKVLKLKKTKKLK